MSALGPSGRVITFYSYKGGTGRSMALVTLAWVLASNGKSVLAVDWDLEAPGLHRYFRPFLVDPELRDTPGLVDYVWDVAKERLTPASAPSDTRRDTARTLDDYVVGLDWDFGERGSIALLPAGRQDENYPQRVNTFDWDNFYERLGGGRILQAARDDLRKSYDYILIDSRTGVSDTSSICTVQLPDMLVVCFTLNHQSIRGASAVARSVQAQRGDDFRIYPVPTRLENAETDKLKSWLNVATTVFNPLLHHVPPQKRDTYWSGVRIPYRTFYAFEEVSPAFKDEPHAFDSILASIERLASWITRGDVDTMQTIDEARREEIVKAYAYTDAEPGTPRAVEEVPLSQRLRRELEFRLQLKVPVAFAGFVGIVLLALFMWTLQSERRDAQTQLVQQKAALELANADKDKRVAIFDTYLSAYCDLKIGIGEDRDKLARCMSDIERALRGVRMKSGKSDAPDARQAAKYVGEQTSK
ncbi:MAG TPA: hypothetical protein VHP37_08110 [Burkholderiales bacterium]|nr:hypothetical protein [Burkholderiales bacterium]